MFRRHDTLSQMSLTLAAALLCGVLLEADGINIWAQRLNVGPVRDWALPISGAWLAFTAPLHLGNPRRVALQAKASLAPAMLMQVPGAQASASPVPTPAAPVALAAPSSAAAASASSKEPSLVIGHEVEVALAGDSMMAVGLAPTLKRWLALQKNVHVTRAYRSGTGLSRPEIFDWPSEYPRMLGDVKPSIVICAMGANDAQNVQIGKKVLEFDTPEWDEYFRARISGYLDILTRERAHVLWVGLPEMRSPGFAKKIAHVNVLLKTTLARYPNTTWLDPDPRLGDTPNKGFQQFRANPQGKPIKMRADDGIHLTDDGAMYLLDPIRVWMARAVERNAPANGENPAKPVNAAPNPAQTEGNAMSGSS